MDNELSKEEAKFLLDMKKVPVASNDYVFPDQKNSKLSIKLKSEDNKYDFMLDINRNKIKLSKITYQNRVYTNVVLARLDLNGPPHRNPDGKEISGNHLHIYKEGFLDKYAIELPKEFNNIKLDDIKQFLTIFMKYCNINGIPEFKFNEFMENIV